MAIDVVANQYHGKVILTDEKSDGSAVILVCEEWDPSSPPAGPALTPTRGPVTPTEPEEEGDIFPKGGMKSLGTLTLDASDMPSGLSTFVAERFCGACIELLLQGTHADRIAPDSERFGFSAKLDDGMLAGGTT